MPVPNARILNPFVPRDDLGIEEDISNKIYLPSDVSLSLATMVGRNGRKPRIVQMDDDGNTLVALGPKTYVGGLRDFITICGNKHFAAGETTQLLDVRGAAIIVIAGIVNSQDDVTHPITASVQSIVMDKTSIINNDGINLDAGFYNSSVWNIFLGQGINVPYINILFGSNSPPSGAHVSLEMYLG